MIENIPSLQKLSLLKIVTSLWNQSNIQNDVFGDCSPYHNEIKVMAMAEKLQPLPPSLKSKITSMVINIGNRIASWLGTCKRDRGPMQTQHTIYWTPRGTIDIEKTVKGIVQNENLSIIDRYGIASSYCLETEIHILWNRMDKSDGREIMTNCLCMGMVASWTMRMDPNMMWFPRAEAREQLRLSLLRKFSSNLILLKGALQMRNLVATKYFWTKLNAVEKADFCSNFNVHRLCKFGNVPYRHYTEIFHFLYSSMEQEYQNAILRNYTGEILLMCLDWPWHNLFFEFARRCWDSLQEKDFVCLLKQILFNQKKNYDDYNDLFQRFWMECPRSFRKFMLENDFQHLFMSLQCSDEPKITLFFKDSTIEEKEKVIFSNQGMRTCKDLGFYQRWVLFKRFVTECLIMAQSVAKFKKDFEAYITSDESGEQETFLLAEHENRQLLNEAHLIFDSLLKKRISEEDSSNESKRCCLNQGET